MPAAHRRRDRKRRGESRATPPPGIEAPSDEVEGRSEPRAGADAGSAVAAGRLLAVDFGSRRIGLAVSRGALALPLATLTRTSDAQAVAAIAELARQEGVDGLVVGEPRRLDGTAGDAARRVRSFADRLAAATGLPVRLVDEGLTSRAAEERLRQAGIDARRHPERIDQIAAQILLEDALGSPER